MTRARQRPRRIGFRAIARAGIGPGPEAILLANAPDGLEAAWLAGRLRRGQAPTILHVARDGARLRFLAGMVAFFAPEIEIVEIPAWDCLPYDRISPSAGIMAERLRALGRLAAGPGRAKRLVLTTANAIVQKVPPPERVRAAHLRAKAGGAGRSRRAGGLSRAQRLPPHQCGRGGRRLCRPRRPGRRLSQRPGAAGPARLLRLDPGIDPQLRSADPALAGQGRRRSS